MDNTEIKANEMVRAIRDRMYEETKDMSPEQFMEYIHEKAARVMKESAAESPAAARPAA